MLVGILGINHKSSDLDWRERIAKAALQCFGLNEEMEEIPHVLLSTCNRTEIYFSGKNLAQIHSELLHLLRDKISAPFEHHIYSYFGLDCFVHLATVTSGLDSAVIFETDIQRQVKIAYENAFLYKELSKELHYLFQKCLKIGKSIRSSFPRMGVRDSLEKIIFQLAHHYFRKLEDLSILFIGNSEINRKVLSFFFENHIRKISLCTRGIHSIESALKAQIIEAFGWERLEEWIHYDLVVCGSNTHEYLIENRILSKNLKKTQLIVDLAVPRNVDPKIGRHPNVRLLNIDELLMHRNQKNYEEEIKQSKELIRQDAARQISLYLQKQKTAAPFDSTSAHNHTLSREAILS